MNSLSLILRILAIVAAVIAGGLFFLGQGKLTEKQAALESSQQATAAIRGELAEANDRLSALENELGRERTSLADNKRELENIRSEMYTARQEVSRTQQQLSRARSNVEELENTARRLRSELVTAEQNIASTITEDEIAGLRARISGLEERNTELTRSLQDARSQARTVSSNDQPANDTASPREAASGSGFTPGTFQPLSSGSLGPATTIQSMNAKSGIIVLANSPELDLSAGREITLVRNLKALGTIVVNQTSDDLVIADILPGANIRELKVGSEVNIFRR
ncbi:MAG: hypothetical protein EA353_14190 [Puniceicoccaceae bacterium]|nr:MAG: hypothetical protein EA353_14190 [Puniceicoccaceae bacterium]